MAQWKFEEGVGWVYYDPPNPPIVPTGLVNVGVEPTRVGENQGPASSVFSPQEYSLLKSEENLAPNFQVDRGLGQGFNNVNYSAPPTQSAPNYNQGVFGSAGVGGGQAVTVNNAIGPNFRQGTNFGNDLPGASAVTYNDQIGPNLRTADFGNELPGADAVTYNDQIGPNLRTADFGNELPGADAVTYNDQIGPDFRPIGMAQNGQGQFDENGNIAPDFTPQLGQSDDYTGGGYDPTAVVTANQYEVKARSWGRVDWRFRIKLPPGSQQLYKAPGAGEEGSTIAPLVKTDGVIFPYTPNIIVNYRANYEKTIPTHSNYASYFYQNSEVSDVQVNATFTAQSTDEADYLMAVIHFFRSATKMFYGQDTNRGMPPPVLELVGFGADQFHFQKAVISQFNYSLPDDVDYIRTSGGGESNILTQSTRAQLQGGNNPGILGILGRIGSLVGIGGEAIPAGAESSFRAANEGSQVAKVGASYVPTKIEISLVLLPVMARRVQSKEFSLNDYAQGDHINGWW